MTEELPDDILTSIFLFIEPQDLFNILLVCKQWKNVLFSSKPNQDKIWGQMVDLRFNLPVWKLLKLEALNGVDSFQELYKKLQTYNKDPFVQVLRFLVPEPSKTQSIEFVDHVAHAHSWYKHLSLVFGSEFVFFLAPNANMYFENGKFVKLVEKDIFHYSSMPTDNYRKKFGHWSYREGQSASIELSKEQIEILLKKGIPLSSFQSDSVHSLNVPSFWWRIGSVPLNACVHLNHNYFIWKRSPTRFGFLQEGDHVSIPSDLKKNTGCPLPLLNKILEIWNPEKSDIFEDRDNKAHFESLVEEERHRQLDSMIRSMENIIQLIYGHSWTS